MSTAIYMTLTQLEEPPTGYSIYASALYGDNGPANGPDPEYAVGNGDTSEDGRTTWNANYNADGSWDSGEVPVALIVPAGGTSGVQFSVAGSDTGPLTYTGQDCGIITGVELNAGVLTNGSAGWCGAEVDFMKNGIVEDSWSGSGPSVDTTTAASPFSEQDLVITPSVTDATSVRVLGNVRFTLPPGAYPGPGDLYANVYVDTTAGGPTS